MINELFKELSNLEEVEAIALGGSRAGENFDEKSDYDVYLYCTSGVAEDVRRELLKKYCKYMEIGNHFWEYEDNCILNNGIDIDILYRNIDDFKNEVASVVEECIPHNGYTTCMWHNLRTCKIVYDRDGRLENLKKRFDISYPAKLKENIINRNMTLLSGSMPAYDMQIKKALRRGDMVSVNHRTAAFMESYFDVIFALNELSHPGEKRLVSLCEKWCVILPDNFRKNIETLYNDLHTNSEKVEEDIDVIVRELKKVISR